jgi:hypothetical protein
MAMKKNGLLLLSSILFLFFFISCKAEKKEKIQLKGYTVELFDDGDIDKYCSLTTSEISQKSKKSIYLHHELSPNQEHNGTFSTGLVHKKCTAGYQLAKFRFFGEPT